MPTLLPCTRPHLQLPLYPLQSSSLSSSTLHIVHLIFICTCIHALHHCISSTLSSSALQHTILNLRFHFVYSRLAHQTALHHQSALSLRAKRVLSVGTHPPRGVLWPRVLRPFLLIVLVCNLILSACFHCDPSDPLVHTIHTPPPTDKSSTPTVRSSAVLAPAYR